MITFMTVNVRISIDIFPTSGILFCACIYFLHKIPNHFCGTLNQENYRIDDSAKSVISAKDFVFYEGID